VNQHSSLELLGMYLDTPEAEEENQEPGGPAGVEEEEEEQDKRGRDDEHERRLGLQLHDLGVRVLLPTQGNIALLGRLQQQRQSLPHGHHFSILASFCSPIDIRFLLCVCTYVPLLRRRRRSTRRRRPPCRRPSSRGKVWRRRRTASAART